MTGVQTCALPISLDKLAGALARDGIDAGQGAIVMSSRLSVDLVQKAARIGAPVLIGASMGGLTSLPVAHEAGPELVTKLVLVDVVPRFEKSGSARIRDFMFSGIDGFASLEEAADAVAAYLPHRTRPRSVEGLKKNLRLHDGKWFWHWDPAFLTAPGDDPFERADIGRRHGDADDRAQPETLHTGAGLDRQRPGLALGGQGRHVGGVVDRDRFEIGGAGDQALRHVAGRGAEHIGQHQGGVGAQLVQHDARLGQRFFGGLVGLHIERSHAAAAVGKHVQRAFAQRMGQRGVGNDEDAGGAHGHDSRHAGINEGPVMQRRPVVASVVAQVFMVWGLSAHYGAAPEA